MSLDNTAVVPLTGGAYTLDQSLRFNDDDSAYLSWTPSSAGNRRTWTWSAWVKRANSNATHMLFFTAIPSDLTEDDHFGIRLDSGSSSNIILTWGDGNIAVTDAIFRDPSAWMHIVVTIDTTQATAADRVKVYINGTEQTFSSTDLPSQNWEYGINKAQEHNLGSRTVYGSASDNYWDGYLAEVNFIDGQALDASYFGETGTYGEWKPKEYTGTYGTNGFYLPFKNDYAVEGFSTVTWAGNVPLNGSGTNYIGGVGFQPDLVWIKSRTSGDNHNLFDAVRGTAGRLHSNDNSAEYTVNYFTAFSNDGFLLNGDSSATNRSGNNYVAWSWDMGANTTTGFGAITYTGTGSTNNKTGFGFQPDFVWIKRRSEADSHGLFDAIRGTTKWLPADQNWSEYTTSNSLTSFDKDGFTLGSYSNYNYSGSTFVAYGWDMGGSNSSNTNGTITSTVRANPTYGQSIISYTGNGTQGATIGHGLSQAPEFVMVKVRNTANNWHGWHTGLTSASYGIYWDLSNAESSNSNQWDDTAPSSSVITLGNNAGINASSNNYICYAFHSVTGYSKFGSYTGDGTTDGSKTISLGFRPAFVMIKRTDSATDWKMFDNVRNPFNPVDKIFQTNTNDAEGDYDTIQFNDTSFGLLDNGGAINNSGSNYIYIAFAGGADAISDYNTDGSIDSRVKANPTYGQSIVSYTGTGATATIGHGLSSAPEMILIKERTQSRSWVVYNEDVGATAYLQLDTTVVPQTSSAVFNDTAPTSSVFSVGTSIGSNQSSEDYIAYCFHSVSGYSKIGSYTGDGTSSNAVTTGFRPVFVMLKRTDSANDWIMIDSLRANTSSTDDNELHANASITEQNDERLEFTDTGFTLKASTAAVNASGGTYIYMAFADKREFAYWLDQSGNNNDWTSNNLTESDISVDSPTNNFATWNPLNKQNIDLSEGNLKIDPTTSVENIGSTMFVNSGKWYWELYPNGTSEGHYVGIATPERLLSENVYSSNSILFNEGSGLYTSSAQGSQGGDSWANSTDVVRFKLDLDSQTFGYAVGSGSFTTVTITSYDSHTSGEYWGAWYGNSSGSQAMWWNFGQDSSFAGRKTAQGNTDDNSIGDFYYTPPSGYLALCTANLPDPAVIPSEHFNTVTWSGNSSNPRSITGVGFQPDFIWGKIRSAIGNHYVMDAVRGSGTGTLKVLNADDNSAEQTDTSGGSTSFGVYTSFDSDGFTVSSGSSSAKNTNETGQTYVAWNWKAGGTPVSNTDGSITSSVSANQDAGFSIVKYTGNGSDGATIGHGLTQGLELVIIRSIVTGRSWWVNGYPNNPAFSQDGALITLHESNPMAYSSGRELSLGSSTITIVDSDTGINDSGEEHIAYCFHSVDGFSKVGSYTGNGSTDGTFVYTGFRPAWIMYRNRDASENWVIHDTKRDIDNLVSHRVDADRSNAEDSTVSSTHPNIDILSNGFKHRASGAVSNTSGSIYLFMAFAEHPFKYTNAR